MVSASRFSPISSSIFVALLVSVLMLASGCSGQTESLVGTWTSVEQGETLDFRSDGTLYFGMASGDMELLKWQADDRSVAIGVEGGGTKTFGYSIDDGVLTLSYAGEESARYERIDSGGPAP